MTNRKSQLFASAALFGMLFAAAPAAAQGPAMSADRRTACQVYRGYGETCCVHVTGDPFACRARSNAADHAGQHFIEHVLVERAVHALAHGARATVVASLVASLATERLDLSGADRLADRDVARCMAGERVPDRSNRVSNPLGLSAAGIERQRQACAAEMAEEAARRAERPVRAGERCGTRIVETYPQQLTGYTPPPMQYVQQNRACPQAAPNCCWQGGLFAGSSATCTAQANGTCTRP